MRLPHPCFLWRCQVGAWGPAFILTKEQEASWLKDSLCHVGCSQVSPILLPRHALGTDSLGVSSLFAFLSLSIHESCIHMVLSWEPPGGCSFSQPSGAEPGGFRLFSFPSLRGWCSLAEPPFALLTQNPRFPPNAVTCGHYGLFSSPCRERWLLKMKQSFVGKACFAVCWSVR